MYLHCNFAGTEIKGYLLVEHPRDDQTHDFTLARRQPFVAASQLRKITLLLPRHTVAIQGLLNCNQQGLVLERLGQKLHGTGFHGLHRHRNISMPGDEDDGDPDARVSQLALQVETVDARKAHVQDKAAWPLRWLVAQEFFRRLKGCAA